MAKRTHSRPTVILFTNTFPYGTGEQFLETEINYLADSFEKVIIVPGIMEGEPRPVPRGVEIETSLAKLLVTRRKKAFRLILSCIF